MNLQMASKKPKQVAGSLVVESFSLFFENDMY